MANQPMSTGTQPAIIPRKTSREVFRHSAAAMTPMAPNMKHQGLTSQAKVSPITIRAIINGSDFSGDKYAGMAAL